jgi:hypothetical protein
VQGQSVDRRIATSRVQWDPGSAIAVGAVVLLGLACLLPWYGMTVSVGHRQFSTSLGVGAAPGGLLAASWGLSVATILACLWRSILGLLVACVAGVLAVVGVVALVASSPTFRLPIGHTPGTAERVHLLGAALGLLAAGLLLVGVIVHAMVVLRTRRDSLVAARAPDALPEGPD